MRGKPFYQMTDKEVHAFSVRQSDRAVRVIPMSVEERMLYAGAVYSSICRFNKSDRRHDEHLRYMELCRQASEEALQKREEEKKKRKRMQVLIY